MQVLTKITIKNLKLNKKRTIGTLVGIILSVALICAVAGMATSLRQSLIQTTSSNTGYWHLKLSNINKEDIEIIFNNGATVAKDDNLKRKAVVKKCNLDKDDDEKAVLYALAKLNGYTARDISRFIKKAKDFRLNEKKN